MNQRKKTTKRLLAGLLCAALVMTDISLMGVQVSANETEAELKTEAEAVEEVFYEEEELTGVYQFGGAPSNEEDDELEARPVNLAGADAAAELEEYIYQQLLARNTSIDMKQYNIAWDDRGKAGSIVRAVLNEHPELYFVEGAFSYSGTYVGSDIILNIISMTYYDMDDAAFKRETKKALAAVKSGMSDLEKAIVLHDYLVVNCEYDYENYKNNSIPKESYSAFGALVNRTAVCQGYALAYKYLLDQAGIVCYMVSSDAMNHAWNLIELNGNYYQVDVTWDDPTWDRIGRACHGNMFRSDAAFVKECGHHDWSVTKGNEVVAYTATDTGYDSAFWVDCDSPLVLVGKDCYYVTYDAEKRSGVINRTALTDSTGVGETIYEIGNWTVWGQNSVWQNAFSGLFYANGRLYYNDKASIYSIAPDSTESSMDKHTEFTADITNGYIYGSAFCQGKVLYSLRQTPNVESKETVLTADIHIEVEEPAEVPVESIVLDKETLELTAGGTAVLEAVVTPDNAADADIIWKSSDVSVATVEAGIVTAIAAGRCTITATAGGKEAVCNVTVTKNEEGVLAGGSFQDITWTIDTAGKLTVTGTGDFSDAVGFDRRPGMITGSLLYRQTFM